MYSLQEIINTAKLLNVNFKEFSLEDLITGLNIELEHGKVNSKTNVTNDNIVLTMKIALAHLYEYPDYYNKDYGLPAFENYLKNKKQ